MSYTKTTFLPVTPDEAFALITEPERLRRWQTVSATVDLRAGGTYTWTVTPGHIASGTYREVEPGKRVVFGWGWDGSPDLAPDSSTVTVTIEPAEGGARVTLEHDGLTAEQATNHAVGWDHFFERLERLATTGDAGPDEWAYAPENLTPVTAAEAGLAVLQPILRNLTPEDRSKQTPCSDFTCHDLAEHLFGALVQLAAMAGAEVLDPQDGTLENRASVLADQAISAWRTVDLSGTVTGPGGTEMPAAFLASVLPLEIVLHAWDLAEASGQQLHISQELVDYLSKQAESVIPGGRERGSFGPEVTPAVGATPIERLAAYAGRTPIAA